MANKDLFAPELLNEGTVFPGVNDVSAGDIIYSLRKNTTVSQLPDGTSIVVDRDGNISRG